MIGIKSVIGRTKLYDAGGSSITNYATVSASDFAVDAAGQLSNSSIISFTIVTGDVSPTPTTVTYAVLQNAAGTENLIRIDLETSVELTTTGTATFAVGALTADL